MISSTYLMIEIKGPSDTIQFLLSRLSLHKSMTNEFEKMRNHVEDIQIQSYFIFLMKEQFQYALAFNISQYQFSKLAN